MMKELNFDTGLVTYTLNAICELTFNPTDGAFAARLADAFDAVDKLAEDYKKQMETANEKELFAIREKRNEEAQTIIDTAFNTPICAAVFGDMDLFALADGLPVCYNLFFAVLEEMNLQAGTERGKTSERLAKYTAKYKKK